MTKLLFSCLLFTLLTSFNLAFMPKPALAFGCTLNTADNTKASTAVRDYVLDGYDGPVYAWEVTVEYTKEELESNDIFVLDNNDMGLVNFDTGAVVSLQALAADDNMGYQRVPTADGGLQVTYLVYVSTTDPNYTSGNFDPNDYAIIPMGDIEQSGCTGASSPGNPTQPDGSPVDEPEPPAAPEEPTDPCEDKTGSDKTSCDARVACDDQRSEGKVFARAFNNACVILPEFIETMVNYVMMFAAIIAGFMFLQGGLKIITSRGNPTAVVEARSTLINAAVGLVLLATAYVIIQVLNGAFGDGVSTDINLLGPFAL